MLPFSHPRRPAVALTLLLVALPVFADPRPVPVERLRPAGIDGALVIVGGGKTPDAVLDRFMKYAGGDKAKLVIIPTASATADKDDADKLLAPWKERKPASAVVLHTRDRKTADDAKFLEPLREATGVWFDGGSQERIADAYLGTGVEKELYALLKRGGVVGGTSAGAAVMSRLMIASGTKEAKEAKGFDLLPGVVVDQHFLKRDRKGRLFGLIDRHPGLVGFGIDEGTALVVKGRNLSVVGDSTVTVYLAKSPQREARSFELRPGPLADLTALRRAALARAAPQVPPARPPVPGVPKGSLVIVGGGGMPAEVTKKFIELAGGPDALIVVLPTANPDPVPARAESAFFERAGAKNVRVLPARELKDVEDPKNLEILGKAGGVWFGGGRQWRFVDAYENTKAHDAFRQVLKRGGVIGGSSAGATIQGDYLCRGSPLNNTEMMCEGYERGLGFLPGVAIDQHFAQRKRFADMTALMKTFPQLLGIGLDEATAIIVKGHEAEVMGKGQVHFYDTGRKVEAGQPDHEDVSVGGRYDLKARKVLDAGKAP
jgi:cyanophycinase